MSSKDQLIYLCKISQQTERYEDMLTNMKKVVQLGGQLSVQQRNLLSVAYKNSIGPRRTAWRAISSIQKKEESKNSKNIHLLREHKKKIENQLNNFCKDIIDLLDRSLISKATTPQAQVFYLKMKGDYYRYISEYTQADQHKKAGEKAGQGYKKAFDQARQKLKTTNPIRLGLALNYSVYFYEVMNDPSKACQLAKQAFDNAIGDIQQIDEEQYKDATTIMQLIRDNLTLWTSQLQQSGQPDN